MEHEHGQQSFRLEITSLHDFLAFVAAIRGEDLDLEKLAAFTDRLNRKSAALLAAETGVPNAKPNA